MRRDETAAPFGGVVTRTGERVATPDIWTGGDHPGGPASMLSWLRSRYVSWRERSPEGSDRSQASESGERTDDLRGGEQTFRDFLQKERVSKQQVLVALGLQPDEFLVKLVQHSGGRMWQADIVSSTGWSGSTVSRHLADLESDGTVQRARVGRRKLVALPERFPESVTAAEVASNATADGPATEATTGDPTPASETDEAA